MTSKEKTREDLTVQYLIRIDQLIKPDGAHSARNAVDMSSHSQLRSRAQPVKRVVSSLASCINCTCRISNPDLA